MRFDPQALQSTAAILAEANTGIQQRLDALEAEADTLIGRWSGEAAEAYRHAQQQWTASLAAMNGVLRSTSKATEASAARYASASAKVAGRFS
jgi:WXG100 family type VII secretion target